MAFVLAHPFRVAGSRIAVVDDASDAGLAQEIAVLVGTRRSTGGGPGERPLVPAYGVADPTFQGLDLAEINAGLSLYGPAGLLVTDLEVDVVDQSTQRARLTFEAGSP